MLLGAGGGYLGRCNFSEKNYGIHVQSEDDSRQMTSTTSSSSSSVTELLELLRLQDSRRHRSSNATTASSTNGRLVGLNEILPFLQQPTIAPRSRRFAAGPPVPVSWLRPPVIRPSKTTHRDVSNNKGQNFLTLKQICLKKMALNLPLFLSIIPQELTVEEKQQLLRFVTVYGNGLKCNDQLLEYFLDEDYEQLVFDGTAITTDLLKQFLFLNASARTKGKTIKESWDEEDGGEEEKETASILTELSLAHCKELRWDSTIQALLPHSQLRRLNLSGCFHDRPPNISWFLHQASQSLRSLEELILLENVQWVGNPQVWQKAVSWHTSWLKLGLVKISLAHEEEREEWQIFADSVSRKRGWNIVTKLVVVIH